MDYFSEAKGIFNIPRPKTFVDTPNHCPECQEVEAKAQRNTPDTLTLEEAGDGWADLSSFLSTKGFLYYIPAFIRLCIASNEESCYIDNLFFSLIYEDENNRILQACTQEQKLFMYNFMVWYKENEAELIEIWLSTEDVEKAIELWSV
ncbi:DUF6714 family protein [Simiduia litorea]|uniref:DUF6714 family protein n=1 Tax=Simiduia litorea TaxID=1435348 RepID=UPI0036F1AD2D